MESLHEKNANRVRRDGQWITAFYVVGGVVLDGAHFYASGQAEVPLYSLLLFPIAVTAWYLSESIARSWLPRPPSAASE